jgi:transposase-like protein
MNTQPKAAVDAAKTLSDAASPPGADTEVVARPMRRQFPEAEKRRILHAADQCKQPGEIGALLRREGVYSSSLSQWRRQRTAAEHAALAAAKRGPKPDAAAADARRIAELTRDNERLRDQLEKAQLVIAVQKKLSALLDSMTDGRSESM